MFEELLKEKIICYENNNEVFSILKNNLKENFFLVRHFSREKKLFFKKFKTPHKNIVGGNEC
jgi:hypothetical protein